MTEKIWVKFLTERDKQVLNSSGYGARAGFGKKPALLIIDVNYNFCGDRREPILESMKRYPNSCGEGAWEALPVIQKLTAAARKKKIPIIYSTGDSRTDGWDLGGWTWKNVRAHEIQESPTLRGISRDGNDIMDEIAPEPQDIVIRKLKPSAFHGTPLVGFLNHLGADSLIITGTTTSGCVRATVIDAFSLNLRTTIAVDGCFDRFESSHAVNLYDMDAKYSNIVSSAEIIAHMEAMPEQDYNLPSG